MNFIKEYQLKDLSICDSLIDLFWKADKNDLTYAGRVGGGSIIPDIKKSKDFMLGEGGSLGKPDDFKYDKYSNELDGFIASYLDDLKIENLEFVYQKVFDLNLEHPLLLQLLLQFLFFHHPMHSLILYLA